jgi:hypothetical protein
MKKIFNTSQKTPPGRRRRQAQMSREACPYISERFAPADGAGFDAGAKDENGHILAGVVGAVPGWVIAMIGGDHADIARPHQSK